MSPNNKIGKPGTSPFRDFRSGDMRHSLADISKAGRLLGCWPSHTVGEGLSEVMDWYVEFFEKTLDREDCARKSS